MKSTIINIILFFCLIIQSNIAYSQRADIDNFLIKIDLIALPSNYIDPSIRTYSTQGVDGSSVQLHGWRLESGNATVNVKYTEKAFEIGQGELRTNKVEKKDKEGNVTSVTTTYAVTVTNTATGIVKILGPSNEFTYSSKPKESVKDDEEDKENKETNPFLTGGMAGETVDEADADGSVKKSYSETISKSFSYTTPYVSSSSAAWSAFNNNKYSQQSNHRSEFREYANTRMHELVNYKYGYEPKKVSEYFKTVGGKKHPEYEKYTQAMEALKIIFSKTSANSSVKNIEADLKPIITYFEEVIEAQNNGDKQGLKIVEASLINLTKLYFYLDQCEKSKEYAERLLETGAKASLSNQWVEKSDRLAKHLQFHHMSERHIVAE